MLLLRRPAMRRSRTPATLGDFCLNTLCRNRRPSAGVNYCPALRRKPTLIASPNATKVHRAIGRLADENRSTSSSPSLAGSWLAVAIGYLWYRGCRRRATAAPAARATECVESSSDDHDAKQS